jgi:hypothetical protein
MKRCENIISPELYAVKLEPADQGSALVERGYASRGRMWGSARPVNLICFKS